MARVLVIDDSPTAVAFAEKALGAAGHEVIHLDCFVDLHGVVRRQRPDVVLLDLEMPGLNGLETGRFLRLFDDRATPLVVYSGRPRDELERVAKEIQAGAIVEKGADAETLVSIVKQVLERQ